MLGVKTVAVAAMVAVASIVAIATNAAATIALVVTSMVPKAKATWAAAATKAKTSTLNGISLDCANAVQRRLSELSLGGAAKWHDLFD